MKTVSHPLVPLLLIPFLGACGASGGPRPDPTPNAPPSAPVDAPVAEPALGPAPAAKVMSDEEAAERASQLCAAIDAGDLAAVEAAMPGTNLEVGIGAGEEDSADRTPLIHAVLGGDPAIVTALVRRGARLEGTDASGHTPLMYAALAGNLELTQTLVQLGARLDAVDEGERVAWNYAAEGSEVEAYLERATELATPLVAALGARSFDDAFAAVDAGASPDTNDGKTCLLAQAAHAGDLAHVERALAAGARPDLLLVDGFVTTTPLNVAAASAPLAVLARIVAAGPSQSALDLALPDAAGAEQDDRAQRVELLLAAGADPNGDYGLLSPAMARAAALGDLDVMRRLAQAGADSDNVDYAYIAATGAPEDKQWPAIQLLEELGADPDNEVLFSNALASAAETSGEFLVRHIYSKATPETANKALRAAAEAGNVANLRLLHGMLGSAADLTLADAFHPPALIAAVRAGQAESVRVLVDLGADVNQSGGDMAPDSALLTAVRTADAEMVRLLVSLGADPAREYDAVFGDPVSALREAEERGDEAVLAALRGE